MFLSTDCYITWKTISNLVHCLEKFIITHNSLIRFHYRNTKVIISIIISIQNENSNLGLKNESNKTIKLKFLECILITVMELLSRLIYGMTGTSLPQLELRVLGRAEKYLSKQRL